MGEQVEDETVFSLQAAPLGVAEPLLRNVERSQVREGLTNVLQAFVQARARRPQRGTALLLRPDDRDGISKQCRALPVARGDAPGRDECECLPLAQGVALDRAQDRFLGRVGQGAECIAQRRADGPLFDFLLDDRREPCCQREAARNPRLAPAEELSDCCKAQAVVFNQRTDDARLVHGRCRAGRRVRAQQQKLEFRRRARAFDHRRNESVPCFFPARQALEAVDDLEASILCGHHTDGEFSQRLAHPLLDEGIAEPFEAGAQKRNRDVGDHGRSARGRRDHRGRHR